jgi:tetratricopeptide (TPR) repeat protein
MTMTDIKNKILHILTPRICIILCLAPSFSIIFVYFLFFWPIEALDTDLWYHLSGGRYFFAQGEIPHTTFFSFLTPQREYVNYYWLFQCLVYKIFTWGNYYGLIILKTTIFTIMFSMIAIYLFRQQKERALFYFSIVFALYMLIFIPRFNLIRPHIFSYFFIVLFLYIFEFQPTRLFFLPVIAVLWCNLHGVEYHVILLITLCYLVDYFADLFRKREKLQLRHLRFIAPVLLTIAAIYLTPYGSRLLGVPFTSTHFASNYISELREIQFGNLFMFQFTSSGISLQTTFNFLILLPCISLFLSFRRKQARISHLLLMAGGIILLSKGVRLVYEFSLLVLPLICANPIFVPLASDQRKLKKASVAILYLTLFLLTTISLMYYFNNPPRYPFSASRLPEGIVTFLNHIPANGKILSHPNWGGYLQWKLYPKYTIFMDMQVPFLFKDEDYYVADQAFSNTEVLSKVINQYEPSFIIAPIAERGIRENIKKFPQYTLVFFDHLAVLYIHNGHHPTIASEYEIKNIDPFEAFGKNIDVVVRPESKNGVIKDLKKILQIDPDNFNANQVLALVYLHDGALDKTLLHATSIMRNFPEYPTGYRLKGDSLQTSKSYKEALQNYFMAIHRSDEQGKREIFKKIGYTYGAKQDYAMAYKYYKKGINVFSSSTTYQELWDLSSAALLSNNFDEAYTVLQFAKFRAPLEDKEFHQKVQERFSNFREP